MPGKTLTCESMAAMTCVPQRKLGGCNYARNALKKEGSSLRSNRSEPYFLLAEKGPELTHIDTIDPRTISYNLFYDVRAARASTRPLLRSDETTPVPATPTFHHQSFFQAALTD